MHSCPHRVSVLLYSVRCSFLSSPPSLFLFTLRRPPTSTLFPYTTLFRSLPVAAVAEALCSAARSMPGTDAGSHGKAHDGSPCGNLRAMGRTASTPAVPTDPASHQVTRYGV